MANYAISGQSRTGRVWGIFTTRDHVDAVARARRHAHEMRAPAVVLVRLPDHVDPVTAGDDEINALLGELLRA